MKKLWKRVRKGSPGRAGEASPKSGSTRGSVASLNVSYEVREKDLSKLHKAAWKGDLNKVKQLAKKDPSPLDKENRTPLHLACMQGHEQVVQELLEWKAKANIGDNYSRTPLMWAIEFQHEGCVNLLLSFDVEIDTADSQGNTPLLIAVVGASLGIISTLIKNGASLNARNKEGYAPLHMAVRNQHIDVCRLLLQGKADVNVEDTYLRTPLMYACQAGSLNLVKLLLDFNADTTHKDSKGWTADDCAVIQGQHACSQLITDHNLRMNHATPLTTPRSSSQPSSVLSTPRDKNTIGLPVLDAGDDDSDETVSKEVSGAPGSDSWADSPDVSVVDDGKKGKEASDIDEDVFEDVKPAAPKVSLAKFAQNIRISESDTDPESVRGSTPRGQSTPGSGDSGPAASGHAKGAAVAGKPSNKMARQISWPSQTSGEDNSWGDSPQTSPRKTTSQKVSFKKGEEFSDIIESEADPDILVSAEKTQKLATSTSPPKLAEKITLTTADVGYVPSITATSAAPPSEDKIRALMAELGISDVDDISEMSEDADISPPLPASQPPKVPHAAPTKEGIEWDPTVVSGYITSPRPGILKKGVATGMEDSKDDKPPLQQQLQAIHQSQAGSGDESSAWDTTEAEFVPWAKDYAQPPAAAIPQPKDSVSEWDSELEDMANPVSHLSATVHPPSFSIPVFPKEVSSEHTAIYSSVIKESHNNHDHDDDWDSALEMATPRENAGLYYSEVNIVRSSDMPEPAPLVMEKDAAIVDVVVPKLVINAVTVRGGVMQPEVNAVTVRGGVMQPEVNAVTVSGGVMQPEVNAVTVRGGVMQPEANAVTVRGGVMQPEVNAVTVRGGVMQPEEEENSESSWDSEADDLPSDAAALALYAPSAGQMFGVTARYQARPSEDLAVSRQSLKPAAAVDSEDEDTETISSWEKERKMAKLDVKKDEELKKQFVNQREVEERIREMEEEDLTRKKREMRQEDEMEEENRMQLGKEEVAGLEEIERQWKEEETRLQQNIERHWEVEEEHIKSSQIERGQGYDLHPDDFMEMDSVLYQQQELNRIDEQFQRERAEREKREQELEKRRKEQVEEARQVKEQSENSQRENSAYTAMLKTPPPVVAPKPAMPFRSQQSSTPGVYANTGSSAVQEIKQRLQVIPSYPPAPVSSTGPFYPEAEGFDDDESLPSDLPGDERLGMPKLYQLGLFNTHSLYRPHDPLDDDALSYTSTEFEDPVQSTPAYGRDREVLASINISDPSSLLKVQEYVRDSRTSLEQERNQRVVLENKLKLFNKEKTEFTKKLESLTQQKSTLEQTKLDLEAKIRSLEYNISEETEKRTNAEILLSKTKEQLTRKESQYSSELDAKQKVDLAMRNLQIEMRTTANTIKELKEEKEELQRQLSHATNARMLQEQINEDQQKLLLQQHQQQQLPKQGDDYSESSFEFGGDSTKLKAELYALKMEMDRQRSRFKDEISLMGAENEELMTRVEELRNDIKLNEEALAHATMQYNIQISSLRSEISTANSGTERERAAKEKLETEVESLKTRLLNANQEMDKAIRSRNDIERQLQREKETLNHEMDRKDVEVTSLKDNVQSLNQRLATTETKLNTMENELHVSNTSLMERTSQLQQLQQELERQRNSYSSLDQNYRVEKEQSAKLQTKLENLQDKWSQQQHENLAMRQQVDSLRLSPGSLPGSDANEKLNSILTNLRADSDRAKLSLEERNSNLLEQVARLKEEVRGSETRRVTLEQDLRRLNDEHNDMVKRLSHAEASLQMVLKAKEQLEQEKVHLKIELEKLQQRFQTTHDKSVEAQARVSELVDRLEKAENSSLYSRQQLVDTSANIQGLVKSRLDQDDSLQQLQIDNARLEAELKYEKQRADMLYQDVQDSQKVRSNLEALCANLKSTSAHLEDRLGLELGFADSRMDVETATRAMFEAEARDNKALYDLELKSRSRLGLRIADLERNKQTSDSKIVEEKNRANLTSEECRSLDVRLEAEIAKNHKLQKDVNTLKMHLKSAKGKIKDLGGSSYQDNSYGDLQREENNTLGSAHPQQTTYAEPNEDVRAELEARYRRELNFNLENVNKFLDSQSQLRESLDTSRTEVEARWFTDKRRLEEEIHNLRVKFEQAIAQRETKEMEAKRFRELYESEMAWRLKVSDQLQMATERGLNLKSKLSNERAHRTRLTGSIGNLSSSIVSNNSFDLGRVTSFHDDELSNRIKAELDRSIAKHLEAAPHNHKPVLRPTKEPARFSASLSQSAHDYFDILNRKYCV